jgi:hypothetical protein
VPDIIEGPVAFLAIDTPRRNPKDIIFVNPEDGTSASFIQPSSLVSCSHDRVRGAHALEAYSSGSQPLRLELGRSVPGTQIEITSVECSYSVRAHLEPEMANCGR